MKAIEIHIIIIGMAICVQINQETIDLHIIAANIICYKVNKSRKKAITINILYYMPYLFFFLLNWQFPFDMYTFFLFIYLCVIFEADTHSLSSDICRINRYRIEMPKKYQITRTE